RTRATMTEKELMAHLDKRLRNYNGDITKFERAIGVFWVGRKFGYKPMQLIHDKRTIKECADFLDLDLKEHWPYPEGPMADKSYAWEAVKKVSNFWKAVKGEIPDIRSTEVGKM